MVHLSRNTPPPRVNDCVQRCMLLRMYCSGCFCLHLAAGTTEIKRRGLGLRHLSCHSPAAYIASFRSSGLSSLSGKYLSSSVFLYNRRVDPQDFLTLELVQNSHHSQKVLSSKLDDQQFNNIIQCTTLTDRARILPISSPHASAWLSVTPSSRLNLHLDPAEFQVALKWWLGIPVVQGQSCPHCPSFAFAITPSVVHMEGM